MRPLLLCIVALLLLPSAPARTQSPPLPVTTPKAQFGFDIGDDYVLANYTQIETYWKKLDAESDRMSLVDIGRSEEGRTQWVAIISAPENIRALDRYKTISQRLAHASGLTDEAGTRACRGRQVGRLDRRRPARQRSAGHATAD